MNAGAWIFFAFFLVQLCMAFFPSIQRSSFRVTSIKVGLFALGQFLAGGLTVYTALRPTYAVQLLFFALPIVLALCSPYLESLKPQEGQAHRDPLDES